MSDNIYYVYIYYDHNDIPRYVGKGKGKRDGKHLDSCRRSSSRNDCPRFYNWLRKQIRERIPYHYTRVAASLTQSDAHELEVIYIARFGLLEEGGTLKNLSRGGDGSTPGPESRRRRSKAQKAVQNRAEVKRRKSKSQKAACARPGVKQRMSENRTKYPFDECYQEVEDLVSVRGTIPSYSQLVKSGKRYLAESVMGNRNKFPWPQDTERTTVVEYLALAEQLAKDGILPPKPVLKAMGYGELVDFMQRKKNKHLYAKYKQEDGRTHYGKITSEQRHTDRVLQLAHNGVIPNQRYLRDIGDASLAKHIRNNPGFLPGLALTQKRLKPGKQIA